MRTQKIKAPLVLCTLTLTREQADALDVAGRTLGLDRQGVLLRGFDVMSVAVGVVLGHDEHAPALLVQK